MSSAPLHSNSKPYQSAITLQTVQPTARSITRDIRSRSGSSSNEDASEARYWAEKFGLGPVRLCANNRSARYAQPRKLVLPVGTAAAVHQIVMGPTADAKDSRKQNQNLLAAVCGPRVPLFGITPQSDFHRALQHTTTTTTTADPSKTVVEADRMVPTGGQLALSASLRTDGRLLAIGTANGVIRIADTTTRATLAQFQSSSSSSSPLPIRSVHWFRTGQHVLAAGDDAVLRVWQLRGTSTSSNSNSNRGVVVECVGHGDVIRCAVLWQKQMVDETARVWPCHSMAATGSYDHTVRIWNMEGLDNETNNNNNNKESRCLSVLSHGSPVEAVEWIQSTNPQVPIWLVSAGGTTLKVWNPVSGLCVCTLPAQHRKTITSLLSMPRQNQETKKLSMRLVTAGLDGLMRIHAYDTATGQLRFVHGINNLNAGTGGTKLSTTEDNFDGSGGGSSIAITSLAATFTGDRIAIGTALGTVLVRQMGVSVPQRKRKGEPPAGTFAFFTRGMNADPVAGDHIVLAGTNSSSSITTKKRKLAKFDLALKQFRYGDALDAALETRIPQAVVAVLEELGKRRGLTIALSNRDEESLEPILAFTARYVTRPRSSALLIGVANKLIDIYAEVAGQSETIDELFAKLKNQVTEECRTQKVLFRVVGQLDTVLTKAEMDQRNI